jgi:DNA-binding NtrC family response regulator
LALTDDWALILLDTTDAPPGEKALRLLTRVTESAHGTPVVLMSGSADVIEWGRSTPIFAAVMPKPLDLESLLQRVAEMVLPHG